MALGHGFLVKIELLVFLFVFSSFIEKVNHCIYVSNPLFAIGFILWSQVWFNASVVVFAFTHKNKTSFQIFENHLIIIALCSVQLSKKLPVKLAFVNVRNFPYNKGIRNQNSRSKQ